MKRSLFVLGLALTCLFPSRAWAGDPAIVEVERAYAEVDFAKTFELTQVALARGGHSPAESTRLYLLLGISSAALDKEEEARKAFSVVIALDPQIKLEKNLSPRIRAPYLEARGAFTATAPLRASVSAQAGAIAIALSGSLSVVGAVELWYRPKGKSSSFEQARLEPLPELEFAPPAKLKEVEVVVRLVDDHGNSLFDVASAANPRRLVLQHSSRKSSPVTIVVPQESLNRTPYHVTAALLSGLGVVAAGAGVVFHLEREDHAAKWNGASCEEPGSTRGEQCAKVDDDRRRAENLAIGLYASGGALLVAGVVTLVITPSEAPKQRLSGALRPEAGPGRLGLSYAGRF